MAGSNGRAKRHFFGGTGLYIALFLGVTALAVAGYWTLLPKNTTDKDAENVSSQVELPVQDETPQLAGRRRGAVRLRGRGHRRGGRQLDRRVLDAGASALFGQQRWGTMRPSRISKLKIEAAQSWLSGLYF